MGVKIYLQFFFACPSTCKKGLKVICSYFVKFYFQFFFFILCLFIFLGFSHTIFFFLFWLFILSAKFASFWKFCFYYYVFFFFYTLKFIWFFIIITFFSWELNFIVLSSSPSSSTPSTLMLIHEVYILQILRCSPSP